MTSRSLPHSICLSIGVVLLLAAMPSPADTEFGGHVKTRLLGERFPADSIFRNLAGTTTAALESDLRLQAAFVDGPWSFDAAWQLSFSLGERVEVFGNALLPGAAGADRLDPDRRRLLDLSDVIEDDRRFNALHRIDRLALGFTRDNLVLRLGRQALSWGNGLAFSPMDIVNPFDPTAIDTEYKAGDDMLYGQWLRGNGDDLQAAVVFRRDPVIGDPASDEGTTAIKYHGVSGSGEFDLLLARNRDRTTWGLGGNLALGGAVLRGDVVSSNTPGGRRTELVANLAYSWVWRGKNVSGFAEYYHSDFGLPGGRYAPADLAMNPELLIRLQRGESFTLGRNYFAGGVTIELSPLQTLAPNLFWNLDDNSALAQFVLQRSLSDNASLTGAVNVPLGPSGSEFGGIDAGAPGRYFSVDAALFLQLAWYF